jgi:hypothetical protein
MVVKPKKQKQKIKTRPSNHLNAEKNHFPTSPLHDGAYSSKFNSAIPHAKAKYTIIEKRIIFTINGKIAYRFTPDVLSINLKDFITEKKPVENWEKAEVAFFIWLILMSHH